MKSLHLISAICAMLILTGCVSNKSSYVDANDTSTATINRNRISPSDWVIICSEMANRLLADPNFGEYLEAYKIDAATELEALIAKGEKFTTLEKIRFSRPLLMLDEVKNNTGEHIDTKLMTERIKETLFNSQKVRFTHAFAGGGQHHEGASVSIRDAKKVPAVRKSSVPKKGRINAPNLSLTGVIIKQTARDGSKEEVSYFFSLSLVDLISGEGVWSATKEIKHRHERGVFGW